MLQYVHQLVANCVCLQFGAEHVVRSFFNDTASETVWTEQLNDKLKISMRLDKVEELQIQIYSHHVIHKFRL